MATGPDLSHTPDEPRSEHESDRPNETEAERADRNFIDLLQELRVTQTGVQILFAFLLTLPLQARFGSLDEFQRGIYIASLSATALATVCLIAPVAYHRALFQLGMKAEVVHIASRFAIFGLACLGLAVVFAVNLVFDEVAGRASAIIVSTILLAIIVVVWAVMPLRLRSRHRLRQPIRQPIPHSIPVSSHEGPLPGD